jgi:hypothetical protein
MNDTSLVTKEKLLSISSGAYPIAVCCPTHFCQCRVISVSSYLSLVLGLVLRLVLRLFLVYHQQQLYTFAPSEVLTATTVWVIA